MINDVPTTSSPSRPTPLPRSTPATAARYYVDTDSVDLPAGQKLNHNQEQPRALNNLQPDESGKRASNIYHTINDAPTTSQSLYASPSPPVAAAAVSGSVITESDYSQPINSSDYMQMSPQHSSTSSSSQPKLLSPSTSETAAVYEKAGAIDDEHNAYVQPSKSFDNATYRLCQVEPTTEASDAWQTVGRTNGLPSKYITVAYIRNWQDTAVTTTVCMFAARSDHVY